MISKDQLVTITESSIRNLITTFEESPWLFYTESDLHCFLFNMIFNSLPFEQWTCKTSAGQESCLIHKEYPTKERYSRKLLQEGLEKGSRGHFDLTIWNPEKTEKRTFRATDQNFMEEQHTFIAVEFDLEEKNADVDFALHHLKWDLMKLKSERNQIEHGYLLVFGREWTYRDTFLKKAQHYTANEENVTIIYTDNFEGKSTIIPLSKKFITKHL
jgi:hypothetical protein